MQFDSVIENKFITAPGSGGDGLCLSDGRHWLVRRCIVDMSGASGVDEAVSVVMGSAAHFEECVIRGAGKLVLVGCGDAEWLPPERRASATFRRCVLEDFGRRGPEVQDGMYCGMRECLIRGWGAPERFDTRSFAAWAHHGASIWLQDCVFRQDRTWPGLRLFLRGFANQLGEAWNDEGLRGLFRAAAWIPGTRLGAFATAGGSIRADSCRALGQAVYIQGLHARMPKDEALALEASLESMAQELEQSMR